MIRKFGKLIVFGLLAMLLVVVPVASSMTDTSAASYHGNVSCSHFTLKGGRQPQRATGTPICAGALKDWNKNDTVTLDKVSGGTNPQECRPTTGRVEVCNWRYGTQDGWLGLTQLFFNNRGDHIDAVTVQLNDSFFATNTQYNNDAARRHTICHELGHAMGLEGHNDNRSCTNDSEYAIFHDRIPHQQRLPRARADL